MRTLGLVRSFCAATEGNVGKELPSSAVLPSPERQRPTCRKGHTKDESNLLATLCSGLSVISGFLLITKIKKGDHRMKYYKTVYLLKAVDSGESKLIEVSGKEWYGTVSANHSDPNAQQRYFICDTIIDGECKDRIFMEVTEAECKQWKLKQQSTRRWLDGKKEVTILSLDSPTEEENITLEDTLKTDCRLDDFYITKVLLSELRKEVVKWKPWAGELLEMYLKGQKRASTAWLAEQRGVSVQMARRYRKDFEEIVKKFLL